MPLSAAQKTAIDEVIEAITAEKAPGRSKRVLSEMFLELVDRDDWPEYYQVSCDCVSVRSFLYRSDSLTHITITSYKILKTYFVW